MATYDWISFTTDYGTADGFVAACRGVIGTISPTTTVIDVTHHVPAQDVRRGAAVLARTVPWLPPSVHLAVVDPGVDTERRGLAACTPRGVLVGPDNGLLMPAAGALGGVTAAYALTDPAYHLPQVSPTFHGRDVFAPVAARLSRGLDPARLGLPADPAGLRRLPAPAVTVGVGRLQAEVLAVDGFGNVQLAASSADLAAAGTQPGTRVILQIGALVRQALVGRTFADTGHGELVVYADSADHVAIAVNGGSAEAVLGAGAGDQVLLRSA